jgi:hypothetical protein
LIQNVERDPVGVTGVAFHFARDSLISGHKFFDHETELRTNWIAIPVTPAD